jgi:hypothetical protein
MEFPMRFQLAFTAFLALVPSALIAQAPATPPMAPSLAAKLKAEDAALQQLIKDDPKKALERAESMIPATRPTFDKTNIQTASTSVNEARALIDLHTLSYNAASSAGEWEKAKDHAQKAKDESNALYADALEPFQKHMNTWKDASDKARKAIEDAKALEAKEKRTPEEDQSLARFKADEKIYQDNLKNGQMVVTASERNLAALKAQTSDYDKAIETIDKRIKSESEDLAKFKGDKAKYVVSAVKNFSVTQVPNKEGALQALRRLAVLDPSSKLVSKRIDQLTGKAPLEPEKPVKKPIGKKK